MKQKAITYAVIFQLIIIGVLAVNIYKKRSQILGTMSVNTISKNDILSSPSGDLKYFYEPKINNSTGRDKFLFSQDMQFYTINSDSLNDRFNYSFQKPEGTFRIITLGDSVTFGLHIGTKDNWTEVLEDKLNQEMKCANIKKFEVINLAVSGYDDRYSLERYIKRGPKYDADLVIWLQVDLLRIDELLIPALNSIISKEGNNEEAGGLAYADERNRIINDYGRENVLNYNKAAIENLSKYFDKTVVLASYPVSVFDTKDKLFLKQIAETEKNWHYFEGIRDLKLSNGIIYGDGHPNISGHKMVAEDIFNYLKSKDILSCRR